MAAIEINAENFEEKVIRSDKPVLVDFWAVWCGPCSMMSPIIEQIGEELADKLIVGKVNCDENMELAQQYKVAGIPALVHLVQLKNTTSFSRLQAERFFGGQFSFLKEEKW